MAKQLKGKNAEKLKGKKKDKMKKTLKRMDKVRKDDGIRIRTLIEEKIKFHKADIVKADNFIKDSTQKIESVKAAKLKIEGALISLQEILNNANVAESKS
jgi:hypothetical protein